MPMTVVVTRDVPSRYRGFLSSVMAELAPGVYVAPRLSAAVRERLWAVVESWWSAAPGGSVLLIFADREAPGLMAVRSLGTPPVALADLYGLRVAVRGHPSEEAE